MKISTDYLEEQRRLHASPRGYGTRGKKWATDVQEISIHEEVDTILDYGAGQGSLGAELRKAGLVVQDYDPAVDRFAEEPRPADLVTCTDVLEHVEEEFVDEVLAELRSLAPLLFVVVSLIPTDKFLTDGRQAHITIRSREWWIERIDMDLVEEFDNRPDKQFVALFRRKA